ncbi:MAG: pirin family protein [Planctomycetaceae bacterium]
MTIVYQGEVDHGDSTGAHGRIGPGDVQWMTAAAGVVHEEFHSERFSREGGMFEMVQLWVNLPARDKQAAPGYQAITAADIPTVSLPDDAGSLRVIAGEFGGVPGPARTFTPINMWDVRLKEGRTLRTAVPAGHTAVLVVQSGQVELNGTQVRAVELAELDRSGTELLLKADQDARLLLLTGEPIGEPVVGQGPFVMNTREEIAQAVRDYQSGKMGRLPAKS